MTTQFQHQVDRTGQVINVKTLKGESYQLTSQKVDAMPKLPTFRMDRWAQFKRVVAFQELNVVFKYSGFADAKELKRGRNVLGRYYQDKFMKSALNGTILQVSVDNLNLEMYVVRVKDENKQDS